MKHRVLPASASSLLFAFLLGLYALNASCASNKCPDNAQEYWSTFRQAVLNDDVSSVIAVTEFPFILRGQLDDSPVRHLSRDEFTGEFPRMLASDPGMSPDPTSMKDYIARTSKLPTSFCNATGNQVRVGDWVFNLTPNGWRLVEAYLDE